MGPVVTPAPPVVTHAPPPVVTPAPPPVVTPAPPLVVTPAPAWLQPGGGGDKCKGRLYRTIHPQHCSGWHDQRDKKWLIKKCKNKKFVAANEKFKKICKASKDSAAKPKKFE